MTRRFVTGEISHETNCFSPIRTELQHFRESYYLKGSDIVTKFAGTKTGLGGFIAFAQETGAELIPTVAATATPSGAVARETFDLLLKELLDGIKSAGATRPIDGVLLALHGAMVVEGIPDAEGHILSQVRAIVGPGVPVVAALDYHGNITDEMIEASDGLFGYNTYPHVDGWERALEAARFVQAMLDGKIKPVSVVKRPPLAPAVVPARTGWGPVKALMETAFRYEKQPGVLNVSVYGGFVYSDIYDAGMSFIATTDGDRQLAQAIVDDLARQAWEMRRDFNRPLMTPAEAVAYARSAVNGPIVLADVADNTGGGASGDGTEVLRALLEQNAQDALVVTMPDPEATELAFKAGIGGRFCGYVGGKIDNMHGAPVLVNGTVKTLSDGEFQLRGPMGTGAVVNIGRTAVVRSGGIDIIINERRFQPFDPEAARFVGLDPSHKKIVVLKSAVHYRASYEPLAAEIVEVDGPGLASPNLSRFAFKYIKRPVYPLDEI